MNHMKRIHPHDMASDVCCWTCNKPFTKRQMLYQHFSTVQHQINCRRFREGEIPQNTEDTSRKKPIEKYEKKEVRSTYRSKLFERTVNHHPYVRKPRCSLRSTQTVIPLKPVMPLADPRTDPKVSFLDLVDLEEIQEIKENLKITELLQQLKEEVNSSKQTTLDAETEEKTEISGIQKPRTSRPSDLQAQDTNISTKDPDKEIKMESKM